MQVMDDQIQIFNDDNLDQLVEQSKNFARGHDRRDFGANPLESKPYTLPFTIPLIPQSAWSDLIKKKTADKSRTSDIVTQKGLVALNQQQTEFCWCNAPTNTVRINRAKMNEPYIDLSPASVACKINGFRNQGGNGGTAIGYISDNGIVPVSLWPANAISRAYDTPQAAQARQRYKITQWLDLQPGNMNQVATMLLNNIPIAVGYDWWSHEVTLLDLVEVSPGVFGVLIWNSWGADWPSAGANGFSILSGRRMLPDDGQAPYMVAA